MISFLGKFVGALLRYATQVSIALLIGASSFGTYALGLAVYQFGELFAAMGLGSGAVRFAAMHHGAGDDARLIGILRQATRIPMLGGTVVGVVVFLSAGTLADRVFTEPALEPVLQLMALALPFGAAMMVAAFATTGSQVTRYLVYIRDLFHPGVNLILVVLLCSLGFGAVGAAAAWLAAAVLGMIASVRVLRSAWPRLRGGKVRPIYETRSVLAFSLPLAAGEFSWLLLLWTDILMLGYFSTTTAVGIYRAISQSALFIAIFLGSLNTIFAPMIADLYNRGDIERMRSIYQVATRWSLLLSLPIFLGFVVVGEEVLMVFGSEFAVGAPALVVLSVGQLVNAGSGGVAYMLVMSEHQYQKLAGDLLFAVVNLVLNALLIPEWGVMGAALATGLSIGGLNLLRIIQVHRILRVHAYNWRFLKIGAAALVALGVGFASASVLSGAHFLVRLAMVLTSIGGSYLAALWLLGFEDADRLVFQQMRERLSAS